VWRVVAGSPIVVLLTAKVRPRRLSWFITKERDTYHTVSDSCSHSA